MSDRTIGVLSIGVASAILVPVAIALSTVQAPGTLHISSENPTPLGYTWSLLIFVFPLGVLTALLFQKARCPVRRAAFWKTIAVLGSAGFLLDVFLGHAFFSFANRGAVCGIVVPSVGGGVPIEEFIFYLAGNMMVLLLYIWSDEYWLAAYNVSNRESSRRIESGVLQFHVGSVVLASALWLSAVVYKKLVSSTPEGMPWYFGYLLVVSFVPSVGLLPTVRRFVNWRAVSLTVLVIVLISFVWEASLGVPYAWWGYNHEMMIGIFIGAWHNLPVEALLVWIAVTYTSVILYEAFKVMKLSERAVLRAVLDRARCIFLPSPAVQRRERDDGTYAECGEPMMLAAPEGRGGSTCGKARQRGSSSIAGLGMRPPRADGCSSQGGARGSLPG